MTTDSTIAIIGCGYIGKRLALQLQATDVTLTGIVQREISLAKCQQLHIPCKTAELDRPDNSFRVTGQHVIYLVPPPQHGKIDTRLSNFLAAIKNHLPRKLVLFSTTGVYGDCQGKWINETTALNPTADRAHRRANAEAQAIEFCRQYEVPLVILRVAGIYGPDKLPIARLKNRDPIVNDQDSPYTNRIHADDLADICIKALLESHLTGVYNVTDGHPGKMYDYFNQVASAFGLPAPPTITMAEASAQLSKGMLSYMAESRRISNRKLLDDFNFQLRYPSLEQGLKQCIAEMQPVNQ